MDRVDQKDVEKIILEFFESLGIKPEVSLKEDDEGTLFIEAKGEELGILIGYHGETLEALQLLLGLVVNKKLESTEWRRVVLDVGGWRNEREEALKSLVSRALARVEETKQVVDLPPMPASQRRFVHLLLSDYPEIESHSEQEGADRHIVLSHKG
jgi:spoIIIJ-associated protein